MKEEKKAFAIQTDRAAMMVTVGNLGDLRNEVGTRFQISELVFVNGKSQQQGLAAIVDSVRGRLSRMSHRIFY